MTLLYTSLCLERGRIMQLGFLSVFPGLAWLTCTLSTKGFLHSHWRYHTVLVPSEESFFLISDRLQPELKSRRNYGVLAPF